MGGWSKKSHTLSYNAKSGVGVNIGKVGVRNKFSVCTVARNKRVSPKEHTCFRNRCGSSCSTESDIIVSGFNATKDMHGIQYMT